jgi:HAD superfamily hydrolase (TIGR01509 family)
VDNIKAIIFDMDGLLLDTERIALETFIKACQAYDYEPDLEIYHQCIGVTYDQGAEILKKGYGRDFPYDAVSQLWEQRFNETTLEKPVPLKDGAMSLLLHLEAKEVRRAVVTSTFQAHAITKLSNCGIMGLFEFVLGGDQVSKGKPDPEIYLTACRMLKEDPVMCLALEDSDNGVRSAHSAGLKVIQVPDLKKPSES